MQLILAWVAFPLVLTAVGAGWGVLVEKAIGREVQGALLVALGLMAALVAGAMLTASKATAHGAVATVAVVGVVGLGIAWPGGRISRWPLLAAIGVLLAYGAPVLLSGQATFAGYVTLDDTASWLGITDQLFSHARAVDLSTPSSYSHLVDAYVHATGYPVGSFMLLGVGRGLVGVDVAWVFQPYLALCGVLVGLSTYALLERFVASRSLRAGLTFVAAQPALLYGYSQWGAIKELTAAWLLIAGLALLEPYIGRAAPKPREVLVLALPAAALILTLGAGALIWIAVPLIAVAASWVQAARRDGELRAMLTSAAALVGATALFALPMLVVISTFLASDAVLFTQPAEQTTRAIALGELLAPLSLFQLAGIWPTGDFRHVAPTVPTAILIALLLASASGAVVVCVRRRQLTIALYVVAAVVGVFTVTLAGGTPWVVGKSLAIGSPALLAAGLLGGVFLLERSRAAGVVVCALIAGGVLWSNALAYHDVRLAPRARLAELQHIGAMIGGKGPTLLDEDEIYGTRHFLRAGDPTSPTEFRTVPLALRGGQHLGEPAYADLDAFPVATLLYYRTIVTRRSPTQSRPPSIYRLVWQGHWYQVWQRVADPSEAPVLHVPGGDSNVLPYCGTADKGVRPRCSIVPEAIPPCPVVKQIGLAAARVHGKIVAFERRPAAVARASNAARIPPGWTVNTRSGGVTPIGPGTIDVSLRVGAAGRYELWLGGTFARGFGVAVDGRPMGAVSGQRLNYGTFTYAGAVRLAAGEHVVALRHLGGGLGPDRGPQRDTSVFAVALEPLDGPRPQLLDVPPSAAETLCGRQLDWIEIVTPRA